MLGYNYLERYAMSKISGREHIRFSNKKQQQKNIDIYNELHKHDVSQKPPVAKRNAIQTSKSKQGLNISFDRESLVNGIILSEILGKPKFLRRGRGGI